MLHAIYLFSNIAPGWLCFLGEHKREVKEKWRNLCVAVFVFLLFCFTFKRLCLNKMCVFIIWIICVSLLLAWYDFILYFVSFHSPDVPNTLLPTTIIPSLTTAPVTTTVAITTSPSTSASSSSRRGTVCFFVIASEAQ